MNNALVPLFLHKWRFILLQMLLVPEYQAHKPGCLWSCWSWDLKPSQIYITKNSIGCMHASGGLPEEVSIPLHEKKTDQTHQYHYLVDNRAKVWVQQLCYQAPLSGGTWKNPWRVWGLGEPYLGSELPYSPHTNIFFNMSARVEGGQPSDIYWFDPCPEFHILIVIV